MGWFQDLIQQIGFGQSKQVEAEKEQKLRDVREKLQQQEEAKYQQTLAQNAISDVKHVISHPYFEELGRDGAVESFRYSEASRSHKIWHLRRSVDWEGYVDAGMSPDTVDKIIVNAADGRPPEEWQEARTSEVKAYETGLIRIKRRELDYAPDRAAEVPPREPNPLDQIRQTVREAATAQEQNKGKGIEPEV